MELLSLYFGKDSQLPQDVTEILCEFFMLCLQNTQVKTCFWSSVSCRYQLYEGSFC